MEQPVKLKYEKKSTGKSSIDSSEKQCIVHFENSENNKEVGGLTETGFNKIKEVARKRLTYSSPKDRIEHISFNIPYTLDPIRPTEGAIRALQTSAD